MSNSGGTRECPVCGTAFPATTGRSRPRIYCGDVCRRKAYHATEAEQARQRRAESATWSYDDLLAWVDRQDFA